MEEVDNVLIRESISELVDSGMFQGQSRIRCASCGPERKKHNEKTLSVSSDGDAILFFCHHCEAGGRVEQGEVKLEEEVIGIPVMSGDLEEVHSDWLSSSRGISRETAIRCGVVSGEVYIRSRGREVSCIGFQYNNADGTTATKWRDGAKNFTQKGSATSLWRLDEFTGGDLVICEGEIDALSYEEAGVFATSVPNGAPMSEVKGSNAKKFSYLWDNDAVDKADRIIIATDMDGPGRILSEEIARRVGKARCWNIRFPPGCKDANELLVKEGPSALLESLLSATPWPISGLRNPSEYRDEAISLYDGGFASGIGTGVNSIDGIYRVLPQTLTVVTGIPGSGKSAFMTWMATNLARNHGWNCAVLSAETSSQVHMLQIASVYADKPYMGASKMSRDELGKALDWVEDRFVFIDESDTDIESVLDRAHAAVLRNGVRLLVIDPYNFLTGSLSSDDNGVAHINSLLVALKGAAVEMGIAVWLCAHPTKMYRQSDGSVPVPKGYDISGSAAFYNVADSGITISRDGENKSRVTCWKARFPWIGSPGETTVDFNPETGRFSDPLFGWEGGIDGSEEVYFD